MLTGKDIISRIDQLQSESHISDYDIIKRFNLSSGCMSKLRSSGNLPRLRTLMKICEALEVSLSEFFIMSPKAHSGEKLSEYELKLVNYSRRIDKSKKERLMAYLQGLCDCMDDEQKHI